MAKQDLNTVPEGDRVPHIYPVEFWTEQEEIVVKREAEIPVKVMVKNEDGSTVEKEEMRKIWRDEVQYENIEYVKWMKKGDPRTGSVSKIKIMKKIDPDGWKVLEPHYNAWKKGEEAPVNGTHLENWPLIKNKKQVDALKMIGIYTVEDLSKMPDIHLGMLGINGRKMRDQAKAFVADKEGTAKLAVLLESTNSENEKLKTQVADMQKALDKLTAGMSKKDMPSDFKKDKG